MNWTSFQKFLALNLKCGDGDDHVRQKKKKIVAWEIKQTLGVLFTGVGVLGCLASSF